MIKYKYHIFQNKGIVNMEIVFVLLAVLVVILITYMIVKKATRKKDGVSKELSVVNSNELSISFSEIPISVIEDEAELVEIKDERMLSRINQTMPDFVRVAKNVGGLIHNTKNHGQVVYQAVIPAGEKLIEVRGRTDRYRGLIKGEKNRIKDHIELSRETVDNTAQIAEKALSSAMNVASMVVGQHYMSEIKAQLDVIRDYISKITDFQDTQYRSKVIALITNTHVSSQFQFEIVENDEMRLQEIAKLNQYETTCSELLSQANVTIEKITQKDTSEFCQYENDLAEIQKWFEYRQVLLEIIAQISELKYIYYLGQATKEYCGAVAHKCFEQSFNVSQRLNDWHNDNGKKYEIDVLNKTRKRFGMDKIIHTVPGWIDEKHKLKTISQNTAKRIQVQTNEPLEYTGLDVYSEDVKLISKDGKFFYLPSKKM